MKKTVFSWLILICLSYCTSLALCMTLHFPYNQNVPTDGILAEIFWNLRNSLSGTSFHSSLIFSGLIAANAFIDKKKVRRYRLISIVSLLLAIVWLMGESFRIDNQLDAIVSSAGQITKSVCYVIGMTYLLNQLFYLLYWFLEDGMDFNCGTGKIISLYRRHTILFPFILLLVCWLPQLVLAYPGNMCPDAWNQLSGYWGIGGWTTHHPPTHTLLIGCFTKLGVMIGSGNMGLYLYILSQAVMFAGVLAYVFYTMKYLSAPRWLRIFTFLTAALSPYYTTYVSMVIKDNIYSYAVVLFIVELIYVLLYGMDYFKRKKHIFLMGLSIIAVILFRNNGKYILYPTIILLGILVVKWGKKQRDYKMTAKAVLVLIIPVLLAGFITNGVINYYDIRNGNSIREALSLPLQQTARYTKEHDNEVTADEKGIIGKVLDYDKLAEAYDPRISDPVKITFNNDATSDELKAYFKVWIKQFFKHPLTYVAATVNQNYYLIYPFVENVSIFSQTIITGYDSCEQLQEELNIYEVDAIQSSETITNTVNKSLFSLPVIGMFSHVAFYNLILFALIIFSYYHKMNRFLILCVPILLSDIVVVLAPVIQFSPRYAFPIIYSVPVMVAYFLYLLRTSNPEQGR